MRSLIVLILLGTTAAAQPLPYFAVLSADPGAWPDILSSVGLQPQPAAVARIFVARATVPAAPEWLFRVEHGAILILEADSSLADQFGIHPGKTTVRVNSLIDTHHPDLPIIWEHGVDLPVFEFPADAQVFTRERWSSAPVVAGLRRGSGAVLWVATSPGERGYERFPYLLEALADLGVVAPFRSSRLWAFFDSSYRLRVDLDYYAARWRKAGIAALHVAAWQYYEPDADRDQYLKRLIEACHREGILVYAWLELPHVSEKFWTDHPEWREKTAILQDAELDWRKLMNLSNRDCFHAASAGVHQLAGRFDWDGINLAELYFESLAGIGNPSRFTPLNDDVRAEFRKSKGFDPIELFSTRKDDASRRLFLDFRVDLARRIEEEWIGELESIRRSRPDLDLVLTHVDDRFDSGMRDAIGADAARTLPLLDKHAVTFLIEDPATVWHLGAGRYRTIAERYRPLTPHAEKLAIDLNIVNRYQNVYPTRQQTGTELFQLVHSAAANFQRVALYFENSLLAPDLRLLPAAAAGAATIERSDSKITVNSVFGIGIPWKGPSMVDGQPWPVSDTDTVWLPSGPHIVEPATEPTGVHLLRLNADLKAARAISQMTMEFSYQSTARGIAVFDRVPRRVQIDGVEEPLKFAGPSAIFLPGGRHTVTLTAD